MSWLLQFWWLKRESDSWKMYQFYLSIVSFSVSAHPERFTSPNFYIALPLKKFKIWQTPPLWATTPQNFGELDSSPPFPPPSPPWNQKSNTHFLKKQNILFPAFKNKNTFECWNMNIEMQNLKIKGDLGIF